MNVDNIDPRYQEHWAESQNTNLDPNKMDRRHLLAVQSIYELLVLDPLDLDTKGNISFPVVNKRDSNNVGSYRLHLGNNEPNYHYEQSSIIQEFNLFKKNTSSPYQSSLSIYSISETWPGQYTMSRYAIFRQLFDRVDFLFWRRKPREHTQYLSIDNILVSLRLRGSNIKEFAWLYTFAPQYSDESKKKLKYTGRKEFFLPFELINNESIQKTGISGQELKDLIKEADDNELIAKGIHSRRNLKTIINPTYLLNYWNGYHEVLEQSSWMLDIVIKKLLAENNFKEFRSLNGAVTDELKLQFGSSTE